MAMILLLKSLWRLLKRLNKISAILILNKNLSSVMRDFQKTINRLIRNVETKSPGSPELLGMKADKILHSDDYIVKVLIMLL